MEKVSVDLCKPSLQQKKPFIAISGWCGLCYSLYSSLSKAGKVGILIILCGDLVPREYMQQGGRYSRFSGAVFSKSLIFAIISPYIEAGVH